MLYTSKSLPIYLIFNINGICSLSIAWNKEMWQLQLKILAVVTFHFSNIKQTHVTTFTSWSGYLTVAISFECPLVTEKKVRCATRMDMNCMKHTNVSHVAFRSSIETYHRVVAFIRILHPSGATLSLTEWRMELGILM